jgi:hypothetical protein
MSHLQLTFSVEDVGSVVDGAVLPITAHLLVDDTTTVFSGLDFFIIAPSLSTSMVTVSPVPADAGDRV